MAGLLQITNGIGSAGNTISLIDPVNWAVRYGRWQSGAPRLQAHEIASSLADGAALQHTTRDAVTETFTARLKGSSHDDVATQMQYLQRLFEQAMRYNKTRLGIASGHEVERNPVWLKAKTDNETGIRYAPVLWGEFHVQGNWREMPFIHRNILVEIEVTIRRAPYWTNYDPFLTPEAALTAETLTHPDHPAGSDDFIVVPNLRETNGLTHLFFFDDGSGLFFDRTASTSFLLVGPAGVVGDILYFGCEDGAFHNFVLNLPTLGVFSGYTYVWEYYNGSTWVAFSAQGEPDKYFDDLSEGFQGNATRGSDPVYPVSWWGPSDWVATAINGVTAHWVRHRVTGMTTVTTSPSQDGQVVYTARQPYVELPSTKLTGDVPALARMNVNHLGGPSFGTQVVRVWAAVKSRGLANFVSQLNFSDDNPAEWLISTGTDASQDNDPGSPGGQRGTVDFSTNQGLIQRFIHQIVADPAADDFRGTYLVRLRCKQVGGSDGDVKVRVRASISNASFEPYWFSKTVALKKTSAANQQAEIVDLGILQIPPGLETPDYSSGGRTLQFLVFSLDASAASSTPDLHLYNYELIPVDEALITAGAPSAIPAWLLSNATSTTTLVIDGGIEQPFPRAHVRSKQVFVAGDPSPPADYDWVDWELITPAQLPVRKQMRLYFFFDSSVNAPSLDPVRSRPQALAGIELRAAERWIHLRGSE